MNLLKPLTIGLLAVTFACTSAPDVAAEEAAITQVFEAYYGSMKTADTKTAMDQIASDAVFLESGGIETRDEYEQNHLPADIDFEKQVTGKRGPLKITVEGDTAWVIATTEYDGTFEERPVAFTGVQLMVLTKQGGAWKIRSVHWSSKRR
jgi:ketosteroid isomerase-like protein